MSEKMSLLVKKQDALLRVDDPALGRMMAPMFREYHRIYPDSPAWKNLSPKMQATIRAVLADASKKHKCSIKDLIISIVFVKGQSTPVISVKKRQRIEI